MCECVYVNADSWPPVSGYAKQEPWVWVILFFLAREASWGLVWDWARL